MATQLTAIEPRLPLGEFVANIGAIPDCLMVARQKTRFDELRNGIAEGEYRLMYRITEGEGRREGLWPVTENYFTNCETALAEARRLGNGYVVYDHTRQPIES